MAHSSKTEERDDLTVTRGRGNVFLDLGFDEAEAAELQVKAELTRQIYHRIHALGLTQRQAGERLGIGQPDVSRLIRGRYTGFSTDRLLGLLNALDVDIDIVLHPHSDQETPHRGSVRVVDDTVQSRPKRRMRHPLPA